MEVSYLRYLPSGICNVIGSPRAGLVLLDPSKTGHPSVVLGACENAAIWNLRTSEITRRLEDVEEEENLASREVTAMTRSPNQQYVAIGYANGYVRVFTVATGICKMILKDHRKTVQALNYDAEGMRLVSAADTSVTLWDVVKEAGLFRLPKNQGHTKDVMQARFMTQKNMLVTCSKDETVKMWDLDIQYCFKTILGHSTEVWDFVLAKNDTLLITGSKDSHMRVWRLTYEEAVIDDAMKQLNLLDEVDDDNENEGGVRCEMVGSVERESKGHVTSMSVNADGNLLGCHGTDWNLEVFKIPSDVELQKLLRKRQNRANKDSAKATGEVEVKCDVQLSVDDEVRRLTKVKMSSKLSAFQFLSVPDGKSIKVFGLLANNTLESYTLDLSEPKPIQANKAQLARPGHRTEIRTVSFSSDGRCIATGSAESLLLWNRTSLQCIQSIESDYATCSLFAPGDFHIIIGTKSGKLQIFEIKVGKLLETIDAHSSEIDTICYTSSKRGIVSGSKDNFLKFWDFELVSDDDNQSSTSRRLTLVNRTMVDMGSEVLYIKYSPDDVLLAVALGDMTVKLLYADTLKLAHSLYGHKLPVCCLDFSTDRKLLVTGSADKNIYIWGTDHGEIRKRLLAHDGRVTSIHFLPDTHYFFSSGEDKRIRQWDADSHQPITTLYGHQAQISSMAISPNGNFIASASHDRSLRLWSKSDEIMVLEEEQEKEREREMDEKLRNEANDGMDVVIPGEISNELKKAGRRTKETEHEANRLLSAIDLHRSETEVIQEHRAKYERLNQPCPEAPVHLMFQAFRVKIPDEYVLEVLRRIRSSDLEEALLVLPLSYVETFLAILNVYIATGAEVELAMRCLLYLLRVHCLEIVNNGMLMPVMSDLRTTTKTQTMKMKDQTGFNLAGLQFLKQQIEETTSVTLFADATAKQSQRKRKRAVLTLRT